MPRRSSRIPKTLPLQRRKPQPWLRDRAHLGWIGTLPCLACGRARYSVAAHVRLHTDGAAGRKPSDNKAVPLCGYPKTPRGCHEKQHMRGEQTFWADLMSKGVHDPWGVAERLYRISLDTEKGYAAIAKARPGLPTARAG